MRILLITCMKGLGGTERSTQTLSELLIGRGHEVHLIGARGPLCKDIEQLGVKYFEAETHSNNPIVNAALLKRLVTLLKTYKYDSMHLQMARPVPIAVLAKKLAGSNAKIIWHSRGIKAKTYKIVPKLFTSVGVRAIGNCKAEQEKLVRYGFDKDHVGYLYNPCRIENERGSREKFRAKYGFEEGDTVIGSLSRLHPDRGVHYTIGYFNELCAAHPELGRLFFVVAGDGVDRQKLEEMAAKSPAASRIMFIGGVKDIEDFYAGIDLFWNPVAFIGDQSAGTGNTIIEAAFQGVAAVSHNWGGVSEIIIDGVTGGLSEIGDQETFVKKTVDLLADKSYREETITKAFSHVSELVGSAACVEKLERYYQTL